VVALPSRPKYSPFVTLLWIGIVIAGLLLIGLGITYWPQRLSIVTTLPSLISVDSPPPSFNNPPVYPGAQEVKLISSKPCGKEITFTSNDTNDQIATFYQDAIAKEGWIGPDILYGDSYFRWIHSALNGKPLNSYEFSIHFTGYSKKEIRLVAGNCYEQESQAEEAGGTTSPVPTPTPPVINITRQQYEEALAKWRAAGIEEYEVTVAIYAYPGGTNTLRVGDHGKKILILQPSPTPAITPDPQYPEYLQEYTIEGMFAEIDDALKSVATADIDTALTKDGFYTAYSVEFDPDLGYPVQISTASITAPNVVISDGFSVQTVKELRLVKRSAPTP
jgi:hypothetical protein